MEYSIIVGFQRVPSSSSGFPSMSYNPVLSLDFVGLGQTMSSRKHRQVIIVIVLSSKQQPYPNQWFWNKVLSHFQQLMPCKQMLPHQHAILQFTSYTVTLYWHQVNQTFMLGTQKAATSHLDFKRLVLLCFKYGLNPTFQSPSTHSHPNLYGLHLNPFQKEAACELCLP